jgi:alkylated DNA repair protein (DNA oxidative demethylase)
MTSLFDSDSSLRSREPPEEGTVLLRSFATAEAPLLVEEVARIAQAAAFRHLVTPGGYTSGRGPALRFQDPRGRKGIRSGRIPNRRGRNWSSGGAAAFRKLPHLTSGARDP